MKNNDTFKIIATIKTDFPTKFGIPRQSGLIPELKGKIVFEPEYRNDSALRGLEGFSHLWILWKFSEAVSENWLPTVRPPRLGGNKRVGVFATRSPFRPNPIGLSSVKIEKIIANTPEGMVIEVSGADLMDGTPIYDIKPYIAYTDSHPDAICGFSDDVYNKNVKVVFSESTKENIPIQTLNSITKILENNPKPGYQNDDERIYSFEFAGFNIKFKSNSEEITIIKIEKIN